MTQFEAALRRIVADFEADDIRFALVGGLAVSVRAEPRLTRDADFAVSVENDEAAETVVRRLIARGYWPGQVLEHGTGRLATVRMTDPHPPELAIDLIFASSGIEGEVVASAERLEVLPGLMIPVATTGHLMAMKLLARDDRLRPTDAGDLGALASVAEEGDWIESRAAVELILGRGYGRGRDLGAALAALRSD